MRHRPTEHSQRYSLYSAVRIIPVALALLVFQTFPLLYMLISWAAGHEKLDRRDPWQFSNIIVR